MILSAKTESLTETLLSVESESLTEKYVWLEESGKQETLQWIKSQNKRTYKKFGLENEKEDCKRFAHQLNDQTNFEIARNLGGKDKYLYHYFRSNTVEFKKGAIRRTTIKSYKTEAPSWEIVFHIDKYNNEDNNGINDWEWDGGRVILTEGEDSNTVGDEVGVASRLLIKLIQGNGGTKVVFREVDLTRCEIVPENEFRLPFDCCIRYKDIDTLLVTNTETVNSENPSSCLSRLLNCLPSFIFKHKKKQETVFMTIEEWKRCDYNWSEKVTVFSAPFEDGFLYSQCVRTHGYVYEYIEQQKSYFQSAYYFFEASADEYIQLRIPNDVKIISFIADQVLLHVGSDWCSYRAGSIIALEFGALIRESIALRCDSVSKLSIFKGNDIAYLFEPSYSHTLSMSSIDCSSRDNGKIAVTKNCLILNVFDCHYGSDDLLICNYNSKLKKWSSRGIRIKDMVRKHEQVEVFPFSKYQNDDFWLESSSYSKPKTIAIVSPSDGISDDRIEIIKQEPNFYDSTGVVTEYHETTSLDGTKVKYFLVYKKNLNGECPKNTPTIMHGYGGFGTSQCKPNYVPLFGFGWLEKGFVYCDANIRGGGEHPDQPLIRETIPKSFEDFEAIALDLINKGITSRSKLGCCGASSGGLLCANMLTRHSNLFSAIICEVPLLDLKCIKDSHYNHWKGYWGDPSSDEDWKYMRNMSPYHMLVDSESYCPVLFVTATGDHVCNPGQVRKMAKRMQDNGCLNTTYFYEFNHQGHANSSIENHSYKLKLFHRFFEFYLNAEARARVKLPE